MHGSVNGRGLNRANADGDDMRNNLNDQLGINTFEAREVMRGSMWKDLLLSAGVPAATIDDLLRREANGEQIADDVNQIYCATVR
jgi:sporulation-control protein spo0M